MAAYYKRSPPSIAADLDYILDPAYKSPAVDSSFTSVYVDRKGNVHDPDYRPFPVHSRPSSPSSYSRPSWELRASPLLHASPIPYEDDYEEDAEADELPSYYSHPRVTKRYSPLQVPRNLYSTSYDSSESSYSYSSSSPSPSSPSPFDESYLHPPQSRPRQSRRRYSSPTRYFHQEEDQSALFSTRPFVTEEAEEETRDVEEEPLREVSPKHEDSRLLSQSTATCVDALRLQWHTVALSLRFSVFRTKRTIRRKVFRQKSGSG